MSLPRTLLLLISIAITSVSAQRIPLSQNSSLLTPQPLTINDTITTIPPPLEIIDSSWHPRKIPHHTFTTLKTLQKNRLQVVTHPSFSSPVLIKLESLHEATAYRLLHGSGATPEFLGFVTQDSEPIGFITEYIDSNDEEVEGEGVGKGRSKEGCLAVLEKVHERGIAHGDAHDGNCMVRSNGSSVLIDFELFQETWDMAEFERDLDIMGRCLEQVLWESS